MDRVGIYISCTRVIIEETGMHISLRKPEAMGTISRDIGQVFFASLFVGQLTNDPISTPIVVSGLLLAIFFWLFSLLLAKEL